MTEPFEAIGSRTDSKKSGSITFDGWLFQADADGYSSRMGPLVDLVVDSIAFGEPAPGLATIRLSRAGQHTARSGPDFEQYERFDGYPIRLLLYGDRFYEVWNDFTEDYVSPSFACVCGPLRGSPVF